MNYSTDKPIDTKKEDLLGRATFSNQLAEAIYHFNAEDGLVIGLFGGWGTGKTSIINMAEMDIIRLGKEDENKPIIMRFAPWNYTDKDNLISLFFNSLMNKIKDQENEQIKKNVGEILRNYADFFDVISIVPVVGSSIIGTWLKNIAKVKADKLLEVPDLDKAKEDLKQGLLEANKKIIVIIDDIDRLTNLQIRHIFQLVKQVADFPNIIYILAMDRDIVCRALTNEHNIDGKEYLEKIIQIPFEIPEIRKNKLHNVLFIKIEQIIDDIPNKVVLDKDYWDKIFINCVSPYIKTIRDINRLINVFQFKYRMLYQETSFEDMFAITTLQVLNPDLYKWICKNRDVVCRNEMHELSYNANDVDNYKLYYDKFMSMGIDPNLAIPCILTIFPMFRSRITGIILDNQWVINARRDMRVACEDRFEVYFMLDLDDIKVSRNLINNCIFNDDRCTLYNNIKKLNKEGNIIYFIEEISLLIHKIPYNRLSLIASVMFDLYWVFEEENVRTNFSVSVCDYAKSLIDNIIKKLNTEEEKYRIICSTVQRVNKDGVGAVAEFIINIENSYGRLSSDSENKEKQIISLVHLKELEKIYVEKIRNITSSESISYIKGFIVAFNLWEFIDKKGTSDYINSLFESEVNTLKFICSTAIKSIGSGIGWSFDSELYEKYISESEVTNIIENFDKNKLEEFTEIEQIKLASFVLNSNKNGADSINEEEVQKLVKQWKMGQVK